MKFCSGCSNLNEETSHFCDDCGGSVFVRAIVIGRSPECEITINDPSVSQQHLAAAQTDRDIVVRDLNSTNGTCINQRDNKIIGSVRVKTSDTLVLGSYKLSVSELSRKLQPSTNGAQQSTGSTPVPSKPGAAKPAYIVGRDPEADFTADVPTVSRRHIQISKVANGWEVTDLNSSNGTFLNSKSNRLEKPALVTLNDVLLLGSYRLPVKLLTETLETSNTNTAKASIKLQPKKPIIIGRSEQCDVLLSSPQVSSRHAKLTLLDSGRLLVEDLGSLNGTYVNGKRIVREETSLDSQIAIGFITIDVTNNNKVAANSVHNAIRLDALHINRSTVHRTTGKNLTLLDDVDLSIFPSELVALMGPSGAGKTTLLQILCGEEAPSSGQLLLNGENLFENFDRYRSAIGYVPQDDILHKDLTVHQALYYSARMRLPPDTTDAEIEQRISQTIKELNLVDQKDQLIGSVENKVLSGGQRKRVNLGVELVSDPVLLFLDEPTSGLSSSDTADIITVLRELANQGKTIILTIHQPSAEVYNKMNYVLLLAKGGQLAFFGPPNPDSFDYFQAAKQTPDEVIANLDKKAPKELSASYRKSPLFSEYVKDRQADRENHLNTNKNRHQKPKSFPLAQFFTLFQRFCLIKQRDKENLIFLTLFPIAIGLLIGNLSTTTLGFSVPLFIMVLATIFSGLLNSCREIVAERAIFKRERRVNLQIMPYLMSKIALLWTVGVVQSLILIVVMRSIISLNANTAEVFFVLAATSLASTIIGLLISAIVVAETQAMSFTNLILIVHLVMGGCVFPLDQDWKKVLASPLISRWATEALLDSELRGMEANEKSAEFKVREIEAKGLKSDDFGKDIFFIFGISLAALMATAFVLSGRSQNKKS
jgi:ABC-type multidrug transport system ATPase subunit/pSer/pThr/pTyr-binding forkhead associated (FHA) protein